MESTYGNREHPHDDPRPQMAALIRTAIQRGGSVVVPSFAVERTQKFLFLLKELMESGQIPRRPSARRQPDGDQGSAGLSEVHGRVHAADEGADREVWLAAEVARTSTSTSRMQESKKINELTSPAIIVSSSGMVTGGRVLHHLMQRLPDPKKFDSVHRISGAGHARLHHQERRSEREDVWTANPHPRPGGSRWKQFSDHADTPELLEWLHTFKRRAKADIPGARRACRVHRAITHAMTEALRWNVQSRDVQGESDALADLD